MENGRLTVALGGDGGGDAVGGCGAGGGGDGNVWRGWGGKDRMGGGDRGSQNCSKHVLHKFPTDFCDFDLATLRKSQIGSQGFDPRCGFVVKYSCLRYPMELPR